MRKNSRRGSWSCVGLLLVAWMVPSPALQAVHAQEFPVKPINLVIPLGAGGSNDLTARTFVNLSTEYLGQPMVIQIRPGGGGAIGSETVGQAKPDGHTLLFGHINCNSILPAIEGRSRGPDGLAAVCQINTIYQYYAVPASSPFKTFKDMIAYAKANPGKLSLGIAGTWSATDFEWRNLELKTGIKSRIVPYDGGGEVLVALLGGHIQACLVAPTQTLPHIRAGKIRALAISGPVRDPELPNVPTVVEEGFSVTITGGTWKAVFAPKGTPRAVIDKLAAAFKKMTENKQAAAMLKQIGDEFSYKGPDEFDKYWRQEFQTFKELGKVFKK
jgi:tripartite-type tricarboxylate transporter receptor subunit TctC